MCNILRQKHYFKVNGDFLGVGRLLGITWVDLLWSLETGNLAGCPMYPPVCRLDSFA